MLLMAAWRKSEGKFNSNVNVKMLVKLFHVLFLFSVWIINRSIRNNFYCYLIKNTIRETVDAIDVQRSVTFRLIEYSWVEFILKNIIKWKMKPLFFLWIPKFGFGKSSKINRIHVSLFNQIFVFYHIIHKLTINLPFYDFIKCIQNGVSI